MDARSETQIDRRFVLDDAPRDPLTHAIIGAAIEVHRELGPGLLEATYEACLAFELASRGLAVERQVGLPVVYKGQQIECGYRLDLVVEKRAVIEVKAVEALSRVHEAQILTYLRLSGIHVGLLINFNVRLLKAGIVRMVV